MRKSFWSFAARIFGLLRQRMSQSFTEVPVDHTQRVNTSSIASEGPEKSLADITLDRSRDSHFSPPTLQTTPLTGKTTEEIANLEEQVLERIPDGSSIGNKALQDLVGWDEALFLAVRNRLRDAGKLFDRARKGRQHSQDPTARAIPSSGKKRQQRPRRADPYASEEALYPPIAKVLKERWIEDESFDYYTLEVTARGGRRPDGVMARPDITVAAMTS